MRFSRGPWLALALAFATFFSACTRDPQILKKRHFDKGQTYFQQGKYPEAAIEFQNAIQNDPKFADAHYQLAQTYLKQADWPRAFQELSRTVALTPENLKAQIDLANLFLAAGRLSDAQDRANVVLKSDPQNAAATIS